MTGVICHAKNRFQCTFNGVNTDDLSRVQPDQVWEIAKKTEGFPGGTVAKNPPVNAGDATEDEGLIPGSRRSPGGGNGDSIKYSCLENSTDRGV